MAVFTRIMTAAGEGFFPGGRSGAVTALYEPRPGARRAHTVGPQSGRIFAAHAPHLGRWLLLRDIGIAPARAARVVVGRPRGATLRLASSWTGRGPLASRLRDRPSDSDVQ